MENKMKARISSPTGVLAAATLAVALSAGWMATVSAAAPAGGEEAAMHQKHRMEHMQMRMKARIAKMASRLEIKASQQAAWGDYVKARESMWANLPARPGRDADAATIARSRADFAADMARKLAVVSDATAKLQAVLTPEQRKVFDEMARRSGHRGDRGGRHGHHGDRGDGGSRGDSHHRGGDRGPDQRAPR
jgi:Spy/CpxP family protein refolding chaperone